MGRVVDQSIGIPQTRSVRRIALTLFVWVVAAGSLVWVFGHFDWDQFRADLHLIRWGWIVPAVVFDVLSYVVQAARWNYVLRPLGAPSLYRATQAIYLGLFTNEILPLRSGEVIRAWMVSRWTGTRLPVVLVSVAVERLLDAIWLAIGFGITALLIPLPALVARGAQILGVFTLACTGIVIFVLAVGRRLTEPLERTRLGRRGPLAWLLHLIDHLIDGLNQIGHSRWLYWAAGTSLLLLLTQILALWAMMWGYGLQHSFWVGSAVLLIVHLGTAIPNAPANIGSFQVACVAGLTLFGVDRTTAAHFSVVTFAILTVPLVTFGFIALLQSGVSVTELRRRVRERMS